MEHEDLEWAFGGKHALVTGDDALGSELGRRGRHQSCLRVSLVRDGSHVADVCELEVLSKISRGVSLRIDMSKISQFIVLSPRDGMCHSLLRRQASRILLYKSMHHAVNNWTGTGRSMERAFILSDQLRPSFVLGVLFAGSEWRQVCSAIYRCKSLSGDGDV